MSIADRLRDVDGGVHAFSTAFGRGEPARRARALCGAALVGEAANERVDGDTWAGGSVGPRNWTRIPSTATCDACMRIITIRNASRALTDMA